MIAHSDEWNNTYFDRNVNTNFIMHEADTEWTMRRGGLAGTAPSLEPIVPQPHLTAHTDAWNAYYFDRNVNTTFIMREANNEWNLRRGGLAK